MMNPNVMTAEKSTTMPEMCCQTWRSFSLFQSFATIFLNKLLIKCWPFATSLSPHVLEGSKDHGLNFYYFLG